MSDFTWIPLYREIAKQLLDYENRQSELITWLKQIKAMDLPVIPLGDVAENDVHIEIDEIDPFTFFATFNRGIRDSARIEILKRLKEWWNLERDLPTDFKGVPLVNNMRSWFFHWKKDRTPDEISNLWSLAREILDKPFDKLEAEIFDSCLKRTARGMLTMGMFWINPYNYLALDRNNRKYLRKFGIESENAKSAQSYIQVCREVREKLNEDFPNISHNARFDTDAVKTPSFKKTKTPRIWTIGTGDNGSQWQDFLNNQIIAINYDGTEDLRNYKSIEDIKQKVWGNEVGGKHSRRNDALACWQFAHDMQVGDYVFAKQGTKYFYGLCRVSGKYEFDESRETYQHIRTVEWVSEGGPWEITPDIQPAYKTLTEIGTYSDYVRRLFEMVNVQLPESINIPIPVNNNDKKYWWINANPRIWNFDDLKIGDTQSYTTHNDHGNKRQKYKYFSEVKPGDLVVGYVTSPQKEVTAVCEVTKGLHVNEKGESIEFRLSEFFNNPLSYEELKANPDLAECEPLKNNQGSLFKLEESEYETIRAILDELNPAPKKVIISSYTKQDALLELFFPESQLDHILSLLKRKKNIILQGPPGVGKTFVAKRLAFLQMGKKDNSRVEMVQFHQSYTYEDFVQGYRLNENGNFVIKNGIFFDFCRRAQRDTEKDYFFVIDEINRGNLSKIFGELMMLIEHDKRGREFELPLTYARSSEDRFFIPENLYLIGTMNTADRSLSIVDYALRRRFAFVTLKPQFASEKFSRTLASAGASSALIGKIVDRMIKLNSLISSDNRNLGEGFCIGHSYFCPSKDIQLNNSWYSEVIESEIQPLLEEYWIDQENKVRDEIKLLLEGDF
jgi:5-methylcytosine-specific restriction protein B